MVLRIGHRGAAGHAPENTLRAIERAIAFGADLVELDVQRTADGHLVIMHDKRVDRTTNGTGYVREMTLDELRKLDAGNGQRVPTLEEVIDLAKGRVGLMLEIISQETGAQVWSTLSQTGFGGPVIYAAFLHSELLQIRDVGPTAVTLALLEGVPVRPTAFAEDAKVSHVGIAMDSITRPFVNGLRSAGFRVFVYTVNDPRDIGWVRSLGVDGIISDFPERI